MWNQLSWSSWSTFQVSSWFHEIFQRNCVEVTVWKFRKFSPTSKIFRQIDLQYNSLVKKLIWRNFCKKLRGKKLQISTLCCGEWIIVISTPWNISYLWKNFVKWSDVYWTCTICTLQYHLPHNVIFLNFPHSVRRFSDKNFVKLTILYVKNFTKLLSIMHCIIAAKSFSA